MISERVDGYDNWSRYDKVTLKGEVPQEVIDQAIADDNYEIIQEWLVQNRGDLDEVDRDHGDQQWGDGEETHWEFDSVNSDTDLEGQFNKYRE